jgi:hypothetical protein
MRLRYNLLMHYAALKAVLLPVPNLKPTLRDEGEGGWS